MTLDLLRRFIERSDGEADNDGKAAFHLHITAVYGTVDTPLPMWYHHIELPHSTRQRTLALGWWTSLFQCGIIILDYHILLDSRHLPAPLQNEGKSWDEQRLGLLAKSFISDLAATLDDWYLIVCLYFQSMEFYKKKHKHTNELPFELLLKLFIIIEKEFPKFLATSRQGIQILILTSILAKIVHIISTLMEKRIYT